MYEYSGYQPKKRTTNSPQATNLVCVSVFLFICKPIVKFCKDFCLWTSMHGFNHIAWARRHWFERLLWAVVTALAIWGALDISLGQLQRYNENPTVVALEKDFRNWRYNLPAVTACEENRVNPAKLPEMIKSFWNVTPDHAKYEYYSKFVYTVANSNIYNLTGYQQFKDDESLNVDLFKLTMEVVPELSLKVSWSGEIDPPLPPNLAWTPVMIEEGACYTLNSVAIGDIATVSVSSNETGLFPITCKYSPVFCFIMLEISTGSFNFYVHSNFDVVDITFPPFSVILTQIRTTYLDVITTRDGRGVQDLAPTRRGCRYTSEPMENRKVFSTNTCRLSCRSKLAIKYCGCKPFYYFYEEGEVCGVAGMACLATHKQVLANNGGARCSCAQQCVDAIFKEVSTINKFWDKGVLMNRGTLRLVTQAPKTRYTREIIFHFQDLVVSFGGAAGLFLGASFISFVEIFYFILEKSLRFCIGNATIMDTKVVPEQRNLKQSQVPYEAARMQELTRILEAQKRFDHGRHMKLYY